MAEESFFSGPNVTWFALGIAAEVFFLGFGITPQGMNVAAQVAAGMGLMDGFNAVSSVASVAVPGMESVISTPGVVETLDFGIG